MRLYLLLTLLSLHVLGFYCLHPAQAAVVVFNVDQANSSLTLSGDVTVAGIGSFAMEAQSAGSLTTSYTGTITVDVDDLINPTTITFLSSNLIAQVSGNYSPADGGGATTPAPGNYGLAVPAIQGFGKIRDLNIDLTSTATAVSSGSFAVASQTFAAIGGSTIDVRSEALMDGGSNTITDSSANTSAMNANYMTNGNQISLIIPSQFAINYNVPGTPAVSGTANLAGSLTGLATVPEPSSCGLILVPLVGSVMRRSRTRKTS